MPIDPFFGSALTAAANLGGGLFSAFGQQSANAANLAQQNMINQQMLNAEMAKHGQQESFNLNQFTRQIELNNMQNHFNMAEAEKARLFSSNEAGRQMAFQYDLATTGYQRAMQDMRKAGLNPILAYQQGGGPMAGGAMGSGPAASGSAGAAPGGSPSTSPKLGTANILNDKEALGRAIGNAAHSAVDTYKTIAGVDLMKEQEKLTQDKQTETKANIENINQDTQRKVEETRRTAGEADNTKAAGDLMRANAASAAARAAVDSETTRVYGKYDSPSAPTLLERLGRILQDAVERGSASRLPPAVQHIVPSAPGGASDFWGTSDKIRQRAEENRRKYGN